MLSTNIAAGATVKAGLIVLVPSYVEHMEERQKLREGKQRAQQQQKEEKITKGKEKAFAKLGCRLDFQRLEKTAGNTDANRALNETLQIGRNGAEASNNSLPHWGQAETAYQSNALLCGHFCLGAFSITGQQEEKMQDHFTNRPCWLI